MEIHQHYCPQCEQIWDCLCSEKPNLSEGFCPGGDLCHIKTGETAAIHTIPKVRRKSRGVGMLFYETLAGNNEPNL